MTTRVRRTLSVSTFETMLGLAKREMVRTRVEHYSLSEQLRKMVSEQTTLKRARPVYERLIKEVQNEHVHYVLEREFDQAQRTVLNNEHTLTKLQEQVNVAHEEYYRACSVHYDLNKFVKTK